MQKLLITGSLSFIFSNFIRKAIYEKAPYKIIQIDNISRKKSRNNIYLNKECDFNIGNINDEHFIDTIFDIHKPDIVIHAAAETSVDYSLSNPSKFVETNVLGTQNIINACIKYKTKTLLYVGTDESYGQLKNDQEKPWTEESPTNPQNPYSVSKTAGEMLVKVAGSAFGLNHIITRSSNNYGAYQTTDKLIPKVIKCVLKNEKIPIYGKGNQIRDWIHVDDNCSAILKILEKTIHNINGEGHIYNISANQEFSNLEVVNEICNAIGYGHNLISHIEDPRGNSHDFRYAMDSSKLRNLGWKNTYKFKDGIKKCCDWYITNQHWALM